MIINKWTMDCNNCSPSQLLSCDYKDLGSPLQVKEQFERYLLSSSQCLSSLISILDLEIGKTGKHDFSLSIDMHDLIQYHPVLGNLLLRYPATLLPLLEESIVSSQCRIVDCLARDLVSSSSSSSISSSGNAIATTTNTNAAIMEAFKNRLEKATIKGQNGTRVHARLVHLPPHGSNHKSSLSSLGASDVGKILQLSGTVTRASTVQMYESSRAYKCRVHKGKRSSSNASSSSSGGGAGGCGACFVVSADLQCRNNALVHPVKCPTEGCMGKDFEIISQGHSSRSDYQEIKVQESFSSASAASRQNQNNGSQNNHRMGNIPRALLVKLQHDLVDRCQPGDDVVVVGTLMSHWDHPSGMMTMGEVNIGMVMHAHSIRVVSGSSGGGSGGSRDDIVNGVGVGGGGDENSSTNDTMERTSMMMMRDEMVQDFQKFWKMERERKRPIAARNFICQAVCPALYGMSLIKLALLLTLIGGSQDVGSSGDVGGGDVGGAEEKKYEMLEGQGERGNNDPMPVRFTLEDKDENGKGSELPITLPGSRKGARSSFGRMESNNSKNVSNQSAATTTNRRREQSHLLLVGDPGCGKSQFLRFAAALCPRSVFTNGSGTSSAGLTCAAIQEKSTGQWVLEAGALVLADRGLCAIDEFSCIKPSDRTTIHEAMEQQTLSVAKAGIVCKLNCRTTVIAVTNAKGGYYDPEKPFDVNVGIEPPLLSRFDLIFKLIDGSDARKDDNVATFLLNRAIQGPGYDCARSSNNAGKQALWNMDKLRAYIATVKSYFHPTISEGASRLLERHYSECRSSEYIEVQVTVRLLESLIRLSQAHARLMHRNIVEVDDAVAVILLMECSVASTSSSNFNVLFKDPATTVFPDEDGVADIEFILDKNKLLEKYHMLEYLTKDDLEFIKNHDSDRRTGTSQGDGWETLEVHQSILDPSQHVPLSNHEFGPDRHNLITSQDHYGRFTQTTSASPPFNGAVWNSNSEQQNNNIICVDKSYGQGIALGSRKRKPSYFAD